MKSTVFALSLLGLVLALSGAASNWWAGQFPSPYRQTHLLLAKSFGADTVVLIGVALWSKFSWPGKPH